MRLLLIGGNGFIGPYVAGMLRRQGHEIAIFHRGTTAAPVGITEILGDRNQLQGSADELRGCSQTLSLISFSARVPRRKN